MVVHPGNHQRAESLTPIPRTRRERIAGGLFQGVTRVTGFQPAMLPEYMRRQLSTIGITDEQINRVLPQLKSLADWPYVWEAEGDAQASQGNWRRAFAAWYASQRILLTPSPLKDRLYSLAQYAFDHLDQPTVEHLRIMTPSGNTVAGILQMPFGWSKNDDPVTCVLMVPGVTGTKEELQPYCEPLLKRGIAVARIDNPGYGDTTGIFDLESVKNPRYVLDFLNDDERIDSSKMFLYGMSLGAFFALHSAAGSNAAGVNVICPAFAPGAYVPNLPTLNLTALQYMTKQQNLSDLIEFADQLTLADVAPDIDMPVRMFHAGRDRTIPHEEAYRLAEAIAGPSAITIYPRDHHSCLEHTPEITASALEFFRNPERAIEHARHASDAVDIARLFDGSEAPNSPALATEAQPRRAGLSMARLPFSFPKFSGRRTAN